jgi:polysaccharide deacetylase 2 family uncharacterized protein YibQ
MSPDKKTLKGLIFILATMVLFQAVSIGVLWLKNARLKEAISKKERPAKLAAKKPRLEKKVAGSVAIILDDWGYNMRNAEELLGFRRPLTISILPGLPFSKKIAQLAHDNNIEVILHLPLEAHDSQNPTEKKTIYTSMSDKEALSRLRAAFDSVPYIDGVSNHMGSKATEDARLMKLLFTEFKKRNLYFLDSLVTNNSVCAEVAKQTGIRFAARSVFLDNVNEAEYIKGQLYQLLSLAKQRQAAIGIGHDRALTLKVLSQTAPEFQREGVEFVYLSELVE